MRKFRVIIETGLAGAIFDEVFEVEDTATDKEIEEEARDIFFNYCSFGYHEL